MKEEFSRFCRLFAVAIGLLLSGMAFSYAQEQPLTLILRQDQDQADIKRVLDIAAQTGRPVTVQVEAAEAGKETAPAGPASETAMETSPEMMATNMGMASWETLSSAMIRGATIAFTGILGIFTVMGMTQASLTTEGSGFGWVIFMAMLAVLAGVTSAAVFRWLAASLLASRQKNRRVAAPLRAALLRLLGDLVCIAVFLAVARFVLQSIFVPGSLSFLMARGIVTAALIATAYAAVGRFVFKPADGTPLINIKTPYWHYGMFLAYGAIGSFVGESVRLAHMQGMDKAATEGWFVIGTTILTILKLVWFIGGRASIREAFLGTNPGIVRRLVGNLLPDFYALSAIFIWLAGFLVAGTPDSARWSFAAGTTQIILLIIPVLALGAYSLVGELARNHEQKHGMGLWSSVFAGLRVLVSGAVWVLGLHLITALWHPLMMGQAELATNWIIWLERFSFAVAISWAVCTAIWKYFETIAPSAQIMLPGQEDDHETKQTSRLSTAMPVVRNLALGAVLAIGGLLILSSLGIDVAPLLAGFGVLGLALSFGSQALVKDVVSGIFFIADDAFRIGEYIDTGKLKGTVEQITLRSVRLRHHNGPIHTIPFGQIGSVTNFSRDWGTIKFELRFERDANAEHIRKIAKKIGLAMLEDPEMGPEFLLPLKMQGIQDITETSMIVRFKFTCRPGNPSILKREAMKRLIATCKEADVPFASNAVTVRSGATNPLEAAAAAALPPHAAPVAV